MTEIRPARAADALRLAGQLAQLGCPSELEAVTGRLACILKSATQQILVAAPPDAWESDTSAAVTGAGCTTGELMTAPSGLAAPRPGATSPTGTVTPQAGTAQARSSWAKSSGSRTGR